MYFVTDVARARGRDSGDVHDYHGYRERHLPAVSQGATDPAHSPGQVRGEGCVHESRDAGRDQGQDVDYRDPGASSLHRRAVHRGE